MRKLPAAAYAAGRGCRTHSAAVGAEFAGIGCAAAGTLPAFGRSRGRNGLGSGRSRENGSRSRNRRLNRRCRALPSSGSGHSGGAAVTNSLLDLLAHLAILLVALLFP